MAQTLSFRNLLAATAVAGSAALAIFGHAGAASASTSDVMGCRGTGPQSLIRCCSSEVKQGGLPNWMRLAGQNCHTASMVCKGPNGVWAAAAAGAANTKKCKYLAAIPLPDGHDSHGGKNGNSFNHKP